MTGRLTRQEHALLLRHQEADEFGKLMWGTGCAVKADVVPEVVFVCDGAVWIWNLLKLHYPHAMQIVDWYHAADRLKRVAQAAFPALSDRRLGWSRSRLTCGQDVSRCYRSV